MSRPPKMPKPPSALPVVPRKVDQPARLIEIIRVSKVAGREGEGFIAPDAQHKMIDQWASWHDVEIVGSYRELDKSGKTTKREGLQAALERVRAGEADGIITASVDRYARSLEEGLAAIRELNSAGHSFVAVREGIEPGMSTTSFGWLMLSFLLMLAEWQLRVITENWLTARRTQVEAGIATNAPFGYVKNSRDHPERPRRLDPDPETCEWVTYMFDRRGQGASWAGIAEELDLAEVPPPGGGERWLWNRVRKIVRNRVYLGEVRSCGKGDHDQFVNAKAHPALVTREQFDRANAVVEATERRDGTDPVERGDSRGPGGLGAEMVAELGSPYILTSILRCASCGGRMNGYLQTKKRGRKRDGPIREYIYYRCRTTFSWGKCEAPAYAPAAELERLVVDEFFRRFTRVLDDAQVDEDRSGIITAAEEALADARDDLDAFTSSPSTRRSRKLNGQDWYDAQVEQFNDAIEVAGQELQELLNAQSGAELPADLERGWDGLPFDRQRRFLSTGLGLVAVAPAAGRRIPLADRVRIWARDEPGSPEHATFDRAAARAAGGITKAPIEF